MRLRQSKPTPTTLSSRFSSSTPVPPSRRTALRRMPVLWSGPKRRAMSAEAEASPPLCTPRPTRLSGSLGARLGNRLMAPPRPLPPGAAPFRKALAPQQHFDALEEFRGDVLARQHAVEAVVGDVVRRTRGSRAPCTAPGNCRSRGPGGWRDCSAARRPTLCACWSWISSLVYDRDRERRVHEVQGAQHADPAAARDLAAGEGLGQAGGRGVGAGFDRHGGQLAALGGWHFRGLGRRQQRLEREQGGEGDGAQGEIGRKTWTVL